MDVLTILSKLKGKVLDAANFDLLRSAYDLQNESIQQLKTHVEVLRDNNELNKDRAEKLESETGRLRAENADLRGQIAALTSIEDYTPVGLPKDILLLYADFRVPIIINLSAA